MKARSSGWLSSLALAGIVLGACSGESPEKLLPGPPPGAQAGTGGSSGSGGSASGPAMGGAPSCNGFVPDDCPGPGGEPVCVSKRSDPANCGECGTACAAQAVCVAGQCSPPPQELGAFAGCGNVRIALHDGQVFWTERTSGRVAAIPTSGGPAVELATGRLAPGQLAVDASGVYWFDAGDGSAGSSKLMKLPLPLDGATPTTLLSAPGTEPFTGLTVASGKLYYGLGHDVHQIATDGSGPSDVVVGVAYARMDTREPSGVPEAISVHGERVYWIVREVGSVESDDFLPGPDDSPRVGHSGSMWNEDLGFAGDYVYYGAFESLYAAQPGAPAVAIASSVDSSPVTSFAVSEQAAFFADRGGQLSHHDLSLPAAADSQPSPSAPLARAQGSVTSLLLDAANLYWASVEPAGACAIRKLPRP